MHSSDDCDHEHNLDLTTIEGIQNARTDLFAHLVANSLTIVCDIDAFDPEQKEQLINELGITFILKKPTRQAELVKTDFRLMFDILQAAELTVRYDERRHGEPHPNS